MTRSLVPVPQSAHEAESDRAGWRTAAEAGPVHGGPSAGAAAFEREVLPRLPGLHRMALRLTHDEQAAEDLVQDTLERAFRNFARFQPGTNLRAWLFRIMTNLQISSHRHQAVAPRTDSLDEAEPSSLHRRAAAEAAGSSEVESSVLERLGEASILAAIDELPPKFKTVVLLSDVQGVAYRGIADALQVPIGTVTSRLFRARRQLRRALWDQARGAGYLAKAG